MNDSLKKCFGYVFNPSLFKLLTVIMLFPMIIPFFHATFGGYVKYLLLYGVITCVVCLFDGKYIIQLKKKENLLILTFLFCYLITIFINKEFQFIENIKQWVYMAVFFGLFFIFNCAQSEEKQKSEMVLISVTIVLVSFILSLISFATYVFNISEWYVANDNEVFDVIGTYAGRLAGLYNANTCGAVAMISIILGLFLMAKLLKIKTITFKNGIALVFLEFSEIIQYLVLVLSKSRASLYSLIIVVTLTFFLLSIKTQKKTKIGIKVVVAFLISISIFVGMIGASFVVINNSQKFVLVNEEEANDVSKDTKLENVLEEFLMDAYENTSAYRGYFSIANLNSLAFSSNISGVRKNVSAMSTNGRSEIWIAALEVFKQSPLFGLTREGLINPTMELVKENSASGFLHTTVATGGLHNLYLTVLVSSGIIGFVIFVVLLLMVTVRYIKALFLESNVDINVLFAFALVLIFLITEFVENRTLYQVNVFNAIFWIYFGYLNSFLYKERAYEFSLGKTE